MQHALENKNQFPKPNGAMIDQVISIVEDSTTEDLRKLVGLTHIMSGHIAQLLMDLTHFF